MNSISIKPYRRQINYYETDQMQVVHHSNYIRFLEECRMDFLRQLELDYDKLAYLSSHDYQLGD